MKISIEVTISDIMQDFEMVYVENFPIMIEVEYGGFGEVEYLAHFSTHKLDSKMVENYALTDADFIENVDGAYHELKYS